MLSSWRRSPIEPGWLGVLLRQLTDTGRPSVWQHGRSWKQRLGSRKSSGRPWRRTTSRPQGNSGKPIRCLRKGKQPSARAGRYIDIKHILIYLLMWYGIRPHCIYRYSSNLRCDPCSRQAADPELSALLPAPLLCHAQRVTVVTHSNFSESTVHASGASSSRWTRVKASQTAAASQNRRTKLTAQVRKQAQPVLTWYITDLCGRI